MKTVEKVLDEHLLPCKMTKRSITESGLTVSTDIRPGEIIIFFRIDCADGRLCLGMDKDSKCCDGLVFYVAINVRNEKLCFLELKAAKLKDAKEQIVKAYDHVKQLLDAEHVSDAVQMACICMKNQASPSEMRNIDELKRIFGKNNVRLKTGVKHDKELGDFLRRVG